MFYYIIINYKETKKDDLGRTLLVLVEFQIYFCNSIVPSTIFRLKQKKKLKIIKAKKKGKRKAKSDLKKYFFVVALNS